MNFLAFISSSAVQICEVHILTYHCCNRFVLFFFFCVRLTFSVPQKVETSMKKNAATKKQQRALSPSPIVAESV